MVTSLYVQIRPRAVPVVAIVRTIVVHDPGAPLSEIHERACTIARIICQLSLAPPKET